MSLQKFLVSGSSMKNQKQIDVDCLSHVFRRKAGQAIVEYFILLVLLTAISIIGSSVFFSRVQNDVVFFEENCFNALGQEFVAYEDWREEESWWDKENLDDGPVPGQTTSW